MENQNNPGVHSNYSYNGGLDDSQLKYGNIYHVIDAIIDTINQPTNRKNAIKFSIRAIGELLGEFPHKEEQNAGEIPTDEIVQNAK